MARLLKIAAAVILVIALAGIVRSAWSSGSYWYGLSLLPEAQISFDLKPIIVEVVLSYGLSLASIVCVVSILMALAGIVERLHLMGRQRSRTSDGSVSAPSPPAGMAPIRSLVSARVMRMAAVVVIITAVAVAILQMLLWSAVAANQRMMHDTYFLVGGFGSAVAMVLTVGAIALIMVALALILDRLDEIQARAGKSKDAKT